MSLEEIESSFKSAYRKSQDGFRGSLEAWAQFYGQRLLNVAKAAKRYNKQHSTSLAGTICWPSRNEGRCICGCDDLWNAIKELEKE